MVATTPGSRRRPRRRRWVGAAACWATGVLLLGGCTGSEEKPPPPDGPGVALEIDLDQHAEALSATGRDELQTAVSEVLTSYVGSAFLGDYPRDDFLEALDSFSSGITSRAAGDIEELTAARFSDAREIRATRLTAMVAPFVPRDQAVGATAHVDFAFEVVGADSTVERLELSGRLALGPDTEGGDWRIYGYDVRLDDEPQGSS